MGKDVRSQSKYGTELLIWGQVEVNCGIVGASAMFLRPLVRQCFQRRMNELEAVDGDIERRGGVVSFAA